MRPMWPIRITAWRRIWSTILDRQTILDTTTGNYYKVTNQLTPGGAVIKTHADGTPW